MEPSKVTFSDLVVGDVANSERGAGAEIIDVQVRTRHTRLRNPIHTANYHAPDLFHVVCELRTRGGAVGVGHGFCFASMYAESIADMTRALATAELGGVSVADPVAVWKKLYAALAFFGYAGTSMVALSILDTACWDAAGHERDLPVFEMLGGQATPLPAYASDRLWLDEDEAQISAGVTELSDAGFSAMKLRIGSATLAADLHRVETALARMPSKAGLLVDANQGWDRAAATEAAARLGDFGLGWLEEPVRADDWEGFAATGAAARDLPIAGGESWCGPETSVRALQTSRLDVFMPDLQRIGGVTGWLLAAGQARADNRVVSPHLFPEVSYSLMTGMGLDGRMEHVSWFDDLFASRPACADGAYRPGQGPGFGIRLADGVID